MKDESVLCDHTFHPSSFRLHPFTMRDGVTGNMSGFEPEDEGSIPSPAATLIRRQEQEQEQEAAVTDGEIFPLTKVTSIARRESSSMVVYVHPICQWRD